MANGLIATLRLKADAQGFTGEIRKASKEVGKLGTAEKNVGVAASRANHSLRQQAHLARETGTGFAGAHQAALRYVGAYASFAAVTRSLHSVVGATIRQEDALAQVEARIRSTGGAAGYTTAELAAMAAGFQQATTYGDEEILELQSTLLSFKGIGREAFEGATEATLNLAVAMRTDLRSAVLQIGKALDDPKRGLDGLSRSGTQFTDAQKEQIKALVDAGKKAEAQALVLKELEAQYGNSARAARDTFGGALKALGNAFGDLQEVSSESTAGITGTINALTDALAEVDIEELHADLAAMGKVAGFLAGVLGVAGVAALGKWAFSAGVATVKTQGMAFAGIANQLALDRQLLAMGRASGAAHRFGGAMIAATVASRGLGASLALMAGPAGWAALAGFAIYQLVTATDEAEKAQDRLGRRVDRLSQEWRDKRNNPDAAPLDSKDPLAQQKQKQAQALADLKEFQRRLKKAEGANTEIKFGNIDGVERDYTAGELEEIESAEADVAEAKKRLAAAAREVTDARAAIIPNAIARAEKNRAIAPEAQKIIDGFLPPEQAIAAEAQKRIDRLEAEQKRLAEHSGTAVQIRAVGEAIDDVRAERDAAIAKARQQAQAEKARAEQDKKNQAAKLARLAGGGASERDLLKQNHAAELAELVAHRDELVAAEYNYDQIEVDTRKRHKDELQQLEDDAEAEGTLRRNEANKERLRNEAEAHEERLAQIRGFAGRLAEEEFRRGQDELRERISGASAEQERLVLIADEAAEKNAQRENAVEALKTARKEHAEKDTEATAAAVVAAEEKKRNAEGATAKASIGLGQQVALAFAGNSEKAFKAYKAFSIAQTLISTYQSATEAYKSTLALGPVGVALAPVAAAAAVAFGLQQVAAIKAQQQPAKFALGGITEGAETFGYRRELPTRNLGIRGEAGPEAILPLRRLGGGELGVVASVPGQPPGSRSNVINLAPHIEITLAGNASAEDAGEIGDVVAERIADIAQSVLIEHQRPGGLLNS